MAADPGGNFASDEHRRVMGCLREEPLDLDAVVERVNADDFLDLDADETESVLKDLEADGDVKQLKNGWKATKAGHEALTGLPADEGGRKHE